MDQLGGGSFEIGKQPYRLQGVIAQILSFIDDYDHPATIFRFSDQGLVQQQVHFDHILTSGLDPQVCQQVPEKFL